MESSRHVTYQNSDLAQSSRPKLIHFAAGSSGSLTNALAASVVRPLEKILCVSRLNRLYQSLAPDAVNFFEEVLAAMHVRYRASDADMKKIPRSGPLVVVANHPFGGIEGMILGDLMRRIRPDVRILGNYLLRQIPDIRDRIIPVDPFGKKGSERANIQGLKMAIRWVKSGGALVTFPSGEVSHLKIRRGMVLDPPWSVHIGRIIRMAKARALPVYFPGRNSALFQVAGMVHPRLRTLMLAREMFNKENQEVPIEIGSPVPWEKVRELPDDGAVMDFLRDKTYFLRNRVLSVPDRRFSFAFRPSDPGSPRPVIDPVDPPIIRREIESLPADQILIEKGDLAVCYARASQIPDTLREIGRLREVTFREVGEGTGRSVDLDRFDDTYTHLFLWNRADNELVGAYRLGLVRDILDRQGPRGLYTQTLFRFKPGFLDAVGPSIELGRSFIQSKYQKKYSSLLLIWQGIGQFILRHPDCTRLFGPVSISRNYHAVSRSLIVQFLKQNRLEPRLSRFVSPRKPYRVGRRVWAASRRLIRSAVLDESDVSLLISEIEMDGKGLPILLQHYLKLNARIIGFNLDADFSEVVDGLILLDLQQTDPKLIRRFMGDPGLSLLFGGSAAGWTEA